MKPSNARRSASPRRALAATLLLCPVLPLAVADVRIEETIAFEGAGALRLANMSGRTINTYSADRARMESDLQMQSRLVRMLARGVGGPTAQIVRLDQDKVYELDLRKKSYVETSLAEHRARLQQAMQQARDAQAQQQKVEEAQRPGGTAVDAAQCEWSEPKAEVVRSGEKATIAAMEAERVTIDARQSCRDRASGQVCEYQMLLDQWVAPDASAGEAAIKFQQAYARQMGYAAPLSEGVAQRAEGQFGRYGQMWQAAAKKLGDQKGYPVRSRFTLALGGPQCGTTSGSGAAAQDDRGTSSSSPLTGIAGQLGGLLKRRKANEGATAAPADGAASGPTTAAGLVRLMTLTSEVVSIRDEAPAPGVYDVPAGFSRTEQ